MEIIDVTKKAERIIEKYNSEGLSPFPFEKIEADKDDLEILSFSPNEDLSGVIEFDKKENKFIIFINTNKPKTRQYFTIAHELGHYFLHQEIIKEEEVIIDGENSLDGNKALFRLNNYNFTKIETEANNFAATLIMPANSVKDAWNTFKNVEECARIFNVSISAMSIRLEKLNLIIY